MITNPQLTTSPILNFSQRAFTRLLVLYPREYRQEYGPLMAQLFKDCSREAIGQHGGSALLALWASTLLDLFKTAFEEHFKELTHMSKEKFIRLGGWALMIGAFGLLVLLFGLGEFATFGVGPLSMLLLLVGTLALRNRYGQSGGPGVKNALAFSALGAGVACIGTLGLALQQPGEVWWYMFFFGLMAQLVGQAIFGLACARQQLLPYWNGLPLVGSGIVPLMVVIGVIYEFATRASILESFSLINFLYVLPVSAYFVLGLQLQRGPVPVAKTATR
ncbi:MAG: hypothetical protein WD740_03220 [Anaerolineales bacterium]